MSDKKRPFDRFLEWSGVFFLFSLFLCVISQMLFRYILHISVPWTEELARLLCIWVTFIGAIVVQRSGGHLRVDYFLNRLTPKLRSHLFLIIDSLICLYTLSLFWGTSKLIREVWVYTAASMPWLSMGYFYLPLLICSLLMIWFLLAEIINNLRLSKEQSNR